MPHLTHYVRTSTRGISHQQTAYTMSTTLSKPPSSPSPPTSHPDKDSAALYESQNVHNIYSQIAPHFSQTRHKPWPFVSTFLLSQRPGSVGLDVGCGNGKYLNVNPSVFIIGSDRSPELVSLARDGGDVKAVEQSSSKFGQNQVLVADGLDLPFPGGRVDFVISVAVVHHFSTRERRVDAVRRLLECVRVRIGEEEDDEGGKVLVYVWALEQGSSRRGWDEGMEQDQLVPWVMRQNKPKKKKKMDRGKQTVGEGDVVEEKNEEKEEEEKTFNRYYHLYRKGELEEDVVSAGGTVLQSGYERDNWWVIAARNS